MNFTVPADHKINLKRSKKTDKSLDLAKELKNQWNMKVTVIPIVKLIDKDLGIIR